MVCHCSVPDVFDCSISVGIVHNVLHAAVAREPRACNEQQDLRFLVAELRSRQTLCPHRIGPVVRALADQRDDLPAFAAQLDRDLAALTAEFQVAGR